MKQKQLTGALTNSISVNNKNSDERGMLSNCRMLQEVSNIYDKAILETFGHLNFSAINVSRYHVYFHDAALKGDTLSIRAAYTYSDATGLIVEIVIHKTTTRKKSTVFTGDFIFVNSPKKQTA